MDNSARVKITKKINQDNTLSKAIVFPIIILSIQNVMLFILSDYSIDVAEIFKFVLRLIVGFIYAIIFIKYFRYLFKKFLAVYLIVILILSLQFLFFFNEYTISLVIILLLVNLPIFIFSYSIYNPKEFYNVLVKASKIIFIINFLGALLLFSRSNSDYNMTLSYLILIPAIVEINEFLNKKNIFSLLIFALSSIIIISFGSRGALLCLIIYLFLRFYIYTKNKNLKIVFLKLFSALLIIFGILNINGIIVFLNNILISIGINSRTLYLFLNNFDHLSGRNEIYELVLGYISRQSLFGSGIGYDRVLLNGAYSHNLILEMIINFGLIVGVLIFVILFTMTIFASIRDIANKDNLITILIILGFVYLMFSGSYLTDITFWIFLGFTISNIFRKNRRKYETNY